LIHKDAKPTQEEQGVHAAIEQMLQPSEKILDILRGYKGCSELIRQVRQATILNSRR
jgi:hypothetical protein